MVAGKVRVAMGLQKSPSHISKSDTPPPPSAKQHTPSSTAGSGNKGSHKSAFTRSFGAYFPRSSAQVQPRPPDVTELLRIVEELRERESRLKTELLEHKLLKESVAILPVLESEISAKDTEIERKAKRVEELEAENLKLTDELEELKRRVEEERRESEMKMKTLEAKIQELKKEVSDHAEKRDALDGDDLSSSSQRFQGLVEGCVKSNLIKNLKGGAKCVDTLSIQDSNIHTNKQHESSANLRREVVEIEMDKPRHSRSNSEELAESAESAITNVRSRVPRVPKPPPRPSSSSPPSPPSSSDSSSDASDGNGETEQVVPKPPPPPPPPRAAASKSAPPPPPPPPRTAASKAVPPPPPPLPKGNRSGPPKMRRVPEVVEFYHSLMRRDSHSRRDSGSPATEVPTTANARDMIGEIENRSAHLHAIKTDVETQGDFIRFLIKEVEGAALTNIEDVVSFVKWLDEELSYLVDERAVLKHFQWPEQKADALREAAFGYCDLKKLESEASSFRDDPRQPCGPALKKIQSLFEKLEHGVYNISRMRESATHRYKVFQIPVDWMLDTGYVSQIKLASVKLAMKYMKRVSAGLESGGGGPEEEELIVQGVRFAFRVHQFAGGYDVETMRAFEELRDKARWCHVQSQSQQHKFLCRSATC
ncbi:protein CHUP1, chloroplastic [Prosopis cineraria]|uniref:protein CHUP1, chloroplastic n=1 Tax=Prosopis cineraria TaxID=364024 RepID=UPI00240FB862|nr:protein CHUP1, chloroplastic [Prosopis cineraria]XP_054800409.1 protein CHUP1, chloroplastic [Prosopis cineraria]